MSTSRSYADVVKRTTKVEQPNPDALMEMIGFPTMEQLDQLLKLSKQFPEVSKRGWIGHADEILRSIGWVLELTEKMYNEVLVENKQELGEFPLVERLDVSE